MKKKKIFGTLLMSTLIACSLASCSKDKDESYSNSSKTSCVISSASSNTSSNTNSNANSNTSPSANASQSASSSDIENHDLLAEKVYEEFKLSFPTATYDDFLLNSKKTESNEIKYEYMSSYITLDLNGTFISKNIIIKDEFDNDLIKTYSKYINDAWVKIVESIYINGEEKEVYHLDLNSDNTFNYKEEYTYDENGNELTYTYSKYINDAWVRIAESIYINGEEKEVYSLYLNSDDTFNYKYEYTYDENGNRLTNTYSEYINNEWVNTSKWEYTYDENGNQLTSIYSEYIDNAWVDTKKWEYTYDENGNVLTETYLKYIDNVWVYIYKYEYTYDENGNRLTNTYSEYINNEGVDTSKWEYTYDENGNQLTSIYSEYIDNAWVIVP